MSYPIQLNVVEASTPAAFDFMIYPQQHPDTYQYLQNQFANISATISDSARRFMEEGKAAVEKFCDGSLERAARATIRMAKNLINPNVIQSYDTLEEIQSAPPLMQRYIMTDPYLREKFNQQLCAGYSGSYLDMDPGCIREWQYDWRRVNNSIVQFQGEGENEQWVATSFFEDLREGDRELHFEEKVDILSTLEIARMFAKAGEDPTCPYGSKIG